MNCNNAVELISLYLDNELNYESEKELFEHIEECSFCKKEFEELKALVEILNDEPDIELPENFHSELMQKINEEKVVDINKASKRKSNMKFKRYSLVAAFACFVVCGTAVFGSLFSNSISMKSSAQDSKSEAYSYSANSSAGNSSDSAVFTTESDFYSMADGAQADAPIEQYSEITKTSSNLMLNNDASNTSERKLIVRSNVTLETNNFDGTVGELKQLAADNGGYIEDFYSDVYYTTSNRDVYLKEGNITIKIPSENYDYTLVSVKELGTVKDESESTEDITSGYLEAESRLRTKQAEEARLIELIDECNSVDEIIQVEARLSEIRSDLEFYEVQLLNWDKLIDFSTINVYITEVDNGVLTNVDPSIGTRIKNAFINSINSFIAGTEDLVVFIAANFIQFILLAVFIIIVIFLGKKLFFKKSKVKINNSPNKSNN